MTKQVTIRDLEKSLRRKLKTAADALNYCLQQCPNHTLGCAKDCKIRRLFRIPPHGAKYPVSNERKKLVKW